jgi:hypothetical protein
MWQALKQSALMFAVALVALYFLTGQLPWQLADPQLQVGAPEVAPKSTEYEF